MPQSSTMSIDDMSHQCEQVAKVLKVLAHPKRLLLLCHLVEGEKSVSQLEALTELSQSQVSQFLRNMLLQGLVSVRSQGSFKYYSVSNRELEQLLQALHQVYC
ncbi:ArsR/SmtB family transcription factor [Paraferrimonas haliotis]|uniref:Transcriptional regulator n=1 Tax=Paraferrimonas haliotis TaxID=2013866 RepID=A0AA37WYB9_9GAMM|nr:metalloregulator ArsR/SmtB family transcription factor [Paraferrimonas haliotis]GLS83585.1 transcriptional regulator [Paraferrimonas haliotis]